MLSIRLSCEVPSKEDPAKKVRAYCNVEFNGRFSREEIPLALKRFISTMGSFQWAEESRWPPEDKG